MIWEGIFHLTKQLKNVAAYLEWDYIQIYLYTKGKYLIPNNMDV